MSELQAIYEQSLNGTLPKKKNLRRLYRLMEGALIDAEYNAIMQEVNAKHQRVRVKSDSVYAQIAQHRPRAILTLKMMRIDFLALSEDEKAYLGKLKEKLI